MYNRLSTFLIENEILFDKQFGFRTNHSTSHAIAHFIQNTYEAFDVGEYTLGIFVDLSKAFDTMKFYFLS